MRLLFEADSCRAVPCHDEKILVEAHVPKSAAMRLIEHALYGLDPNQLNHISGGCQSLQDHYANPKSIIAYTKDAK